MLSLSLRSHLRLAAFLLYFASGLLQNDLRLKRQEKVRYFLLQYSNQFCGGRIGACQEVFPDSFCHRSGDTYVRMTKKDNGTMDVRPGTDASCSCANAGVLTTTYTIDQLDIYGRFTAPQNGGCKTEHGIGIRLLKGTWCETSTFQRCFPDADKFTKMMQQQCASYDQDISGAGMCNYMLNLKNRTILKHVSTNQTSDKNETHSRSSAIKVSFNRTKL